MQYHPELSREENLLLECEKEPLVTGDAATLLQNISQSYASQILTELWGKRLVTRKKIKMKNGGKKFSYSISWNGLQHIQHLKEKGY